MDIGVWRGAYRQAFEHARLCLAPRPLTSIFFGGGTPSLMPGALVAGILEDIAAVWPLVDDIEITLEANPTSVEVENLKAYGQAGVNRLSLGVQAFRDEALKFLGREHSSYEARHAIEVAQNLFERVSFDLIYARPTQTAKQWQDELHEALQLQPSHLSVYQLTLEPGTAFYQQALRGDLVLPEAEQACEMYELTQQILTEAGLPAYEISNHARPGFESRHNLTYWRSEDFLGVGPGAHSRWMVDCKLDGGPEVRKAAHHLKTPEQWLESVSQGHGGVAETTQLDRRTVATEVVMMGLRLQEGVRRATYLRRVGKDLLGHLRDDAAFSLRKEGLLDWDEAFIWATDAGRPKLNALIDFITSRLEFL